MPPFGEECEDGTWCVGVVLEGTAHDAHGHVTCVVPRRERPVVDRENAAVEFVVVSVIFLLQFLGEEPLAGRLAVFVLVYAPVELPAGVGPQLVEAAVLYWIVERKEAVSTALLHLYHLAFHQIAVVVEQFGVENAAHL